MKCECGMEWNADKYGENCPMCNQRPTSPSLLGVSWRIYCGKIGWGWRMYGVGYGTKWFCGLSIRAKTPEEIAEFYQAREKKAS